MSNFTLWLYKKYFMCLSKYLYFYYVDTKQTSPNSQLLLGRFKFASSILAVADLNRSVTKVVKKCYRIFRIAGFGLSQTSVVCILGKYCWQGMWETLFCQFSKLHCHLAERMWGSIIYQSKNVFLSFIVEFDVVDFLAERCIHKFFRWVSFIDVL